MPRIRRSSLGEKTSKYKHTKIERIRETPQNHTLRLQALSNRQTVRHQNESDKQHQERAQDISTRQAVRGGVENMISGSTEFYTFTCSPKAGVPCNNWILQTMIT